MKKIQKNIIFTAVTIVMVLTFVILAGSKVYAESLEESNRRQREDRERVYLSMIRSQLEEQGFQNSGINMTKMTDENDEWEYTVVIYHHAFEWLEQAEAEDLEAMLIDMGDEQLGKISLALLSR